MKGSTFPEWFYLAIRWLCCVPMSSTILVIGTVPIALGRMSGILSGRLKVQALEVVLIKV